MEEFRVWLSQLRFDYLWEIIMTVSSCLLCISFHEMCHGLAAWFMGDDTAKRAGRLTLNPLKHIDPVGLVMLAVAKFGWARPVPVDMRYFKHPKQGMVLTALAGPGGNVLLAMICLMIQAVCAFYRFYFDLIWLSYVEEFLIYTAVLSIGLAVFNLLPIPPLDGSKVLFALLPRQYYDVFLRYERYGFLILMAMVFFGILDTPLFYLRDGFLHLLVTVCRWPIYLLQLIYF